MRKEFFFPSKDGITQIHAVEWVPEKEVTAVLQMCHGMVEHIMRYDRFAAFLAEKGIYVVGNDHLGHGKSVLEDNRRGYFCYTDGNEVLIEDIHKLRSITSEKYPDKPYFMLGHSMGSFLLRQYLGLYGAGLRGAVIMGTGDQPEAMLGAGRLACRLIAMVKGWKHRSQFLYNLSIGAYEKQMGPGWLSANPGNIKKYNEDPMSGFKFTVNAYFHMFTGMQRMNRLEKECRAPKELPLYFVAGKEDPVGDCGKGVEAVSKRYLDSGYSDVSIKLYEHDRHEILHEKDKYTVFEDIFVWIEAKCS